MKRVPPLPTCDFSSEFGSVPRSCCVPAVGGMEEAVGSLLSHSEAFIPSSHDP